MEEYHIETVPGDGNCMFRSLAILLRSQHALLRQEAALHVRNNWLHYQPFLEHIHPTAEAHANYMGQDKIYGEETELNAI